MIPRFSLYQDPQRWSGDIKEDPNGEWVRWKDILEYITFAEGHGFTPSIPEQTSSTAYYPLYDDVLPENDEYVEEEDDEYEHDVYDLMQPPRRTKEEED